MIEITVPLTLPLRAVVRTATDSGPPDWLAAQFAGLPVTAAARRLAAANAAITAQQQQELAELRQQNDAWKRGVMELQRAVVRANDQTATILHELREAAVELAHAIASKLVFQQLATGTFPVDRLVAEVLRRLDTHEPATVKLHPEDLALVQQDEEFVRSLESEGGVRLIADPKLTRGDCRAAAGETTVVYELRRQIEEIRRELLSTVSGHAESGP
jgi:flagellar assembly protein FliH